MGRTGGRHRSLRRRVLQDLPAGSRADGSAAADHARAQLELPRGCRLRARDLARLVHRGLCRRLQLRLQGVARKGRAPHRGPHLHGKLHRPHSQSHFVRVRLSRHERAGRYRLLQLARGIARGSACTATRRLRQRAGGWHQHSLQPDLFHRVLEARHVVAEWPVPHVRRERRRLRARRRRRHAHAQATGRGPGARRSHPRRDTRHRCEPRRQGPHPHLAQPLRTGQGHRRHVRTRRRFPRHHRLHRSPRHGHAQGRSDRDRRPQARLRRTRTQLRRRRAKRRLRARQRQDQHRPPRVGVGHRGRHQDAAGDPPPNAAAPVELRGTQQAHRPEGQPVPDRRHVARMDPQRCGLAPARRRQQLRIRWRQCPRRDRRIPARRPRATLTRPASRGAVCAHRRASACPCARPADPPGAPAPKRWRAVAHRTHAQQPGSHGMARGVHRAYHRRTGRCAAPARARARWRCDRDARTPALPCRKRR